jgi:type III secretion system YscD/HrpQ family protein
MAAKFIAEEGALKGLTLHLEKGSQWIIGRDPDECQLLIEDPLASRKHLICRTTPGGITIENLSTTNPVEVNTEQLKAPRLLQDGDTLKIGSGIYRFHSNGEQMAESKKEIDSEEEEHSPDTIFDEFEDKVGLAEINFDLVDAGRWLLKVVGGPNHGAEFSMQAGNTYVIGTDPNSCDIVFHDTSVSRQHARISISGDDILTIEDLKSRNGTLVDGDTLKSKKNLNPNAIVAMGTTSFVVYDREGEMQTIISPLLPSIVKVLQKEEPKKTEEVKAAPRASEGTSKPAPSPVKPPEKHHTAGAFILIGTITALFVLVGLGTAQLFKSEPVIVTEQVDPTAMLDQALKPFPSVQKQFNRSTGKLFLIGDVLTASDKAQLMNSLEGLKFISSIDDSSIVIDEYVWQEANQLLSKQNPLWKSITVYATAPGKFVVSGYLQTRKQAEQLNDFLASNFPYLDRLSKQVIVEEDVINSISNLLQNTGLKEVVIQMAGGEVTLSGGIQANKMADLEHVIAEVKAIPGIRSVRNFVNELAPEQAMINISDKYEVTGYSKQGSNLSVVINGRILSKGDEMDGMTIKEIRSNVIFLERDGVQYRIDFSR